jgi:hypothetical protein
VTLEAYGDPGHPIVWEVDIMYNDARGRTHYKSVSFGPSSRCPNVDRVASGLKGLDRKEHLRAMNVILAHLRKMAAAAG